MSAGVYMLKTLRDRGLKAVIFEAGNDLGGTWRWNCYPGAAVDSEVPEYEFSWPEVYNTWAWPSNYPTYQDLRDYFDHVDKVMQIKKDCAFHTVVVGAEFETSEGKWHIRTADGRTTKAAYLVLGTGFVSTVQLGLSCLQPCDANGTTHELGCEAVHPRMARDGKVQGYHSPLLLLA